MPKDKKLDFFVDVFFLSYHRMGCYTPFYRCSAATMA